MHSISCHGEGAVRLFGHTCRELESGLNGPGQPKTAEAKTKVKSSTEEKGLASPVGACEIFIDGACAQYPEMSGGGWLSDAAYGGPVGSMSSAGCAARAVSWVASCGVAVRHRVATAPIFEASAAGCSGDFLPDGIHSCEQQAKWGKCTQPWMSGFCCTSCQTAEAARTAASEEKALAVREAAADAKALAQAEAKAKEKARREEKALAVREAADAKALAQAEATAKEKARREEKALAVREAADANKDGHGQNARVRVPSASVARPRPWQPALARDLARPRDAKALAQAEATAKEKARREEKALVAREAAGAVAQAARPMSSATWPQLMCSDPAAWRRVGRGGGIFAFEHAVAFEHAAAAPPPSAATPPLVCCARNTTHARRRLAPVLDLPPPRKRPLLFVVKRGIPM